VERLLRYRGYIVLTLIFVAIWAAYIFYERYPRPEPIRIYVPTPTPSLEEAEKDPPASIMVHVVGAVSRPGVYTLPAESRIIHAVEAAGGFTEEADRERINLADHVQDGYQIYVPRKGETPPPTPTLMSVQGSTTQGDGRGRININTATVAELETLPGIGSVYAQRIVAYRQEHGSFKTIEELENVRGIGPACIAQIRDLVVVD